jgi:hypothetical protein
VHACIEVEGSVGLLDGPLHHYTFTGLDHYFEKFMRYTRWAANDLKSWGRRPSWINLFVRPWARFFKMFILRRGFLDGKHGLVLSILAAFSVFTKYARLWEMEALKTASKAADPQPIRREMAEEARPQESKGKS